MKKIQMVSIISVIAIILVVPAFYVTKINFFSNNTTKTVSSSNFQNKRNENALYDIYISVSGNLMYLQINKIKNNTLDYNIVSFDKIKDENKFIGDIAESKDNSVFCVLTSLSNASDGTKILNYDKGKLKKEISLNKSIPNDEMISDTEKGFGYISYKSATKSGYPNGTPFSVITEKDNKEIEKKLFVKGMVEGYDIKDNYMYINVIQAEKCDYHDVPNNYILKVNRDNLSSKVVLDNKDTSIVDIKFNSQKNMYLLSNGYYSEGKFINKSVLTVYDNNGKNIKNIKLDSWCSNIVIDHNDIAYISSRDKDSFFDQKGKVITIVDTKKDQVIGQLSGFNGPTNMFIKDSYVFVADTSNKAIQVIDTNTKKVIGKIDLGHFAEKLVVVKNKN